MTRQEAITNLRQGTLFKPTLENKDYPEAFDMAIKALQEPILDKIIAEIDEKISRYDHFSSSNTANGLTMAKEIVEKYRQEG